MPTPILATKLYIPLPRPKAVLRPRLIEQLNEGLRQRQGFGRKLTLVSAPAGFGKTTLISEWVAALTLVPQPLGEGEGVRVAWLSLDEGDSDPARFLTYFIAALQTIGARQSPVVNIGQALLGALEAPQPPPIEPILATLLNEIAAMPADFVLVLDDYHVLDAKPVGAPTSVDDALAFLLEHLPPQMHLVIATREDPHLPLARLRARGQLTELRAADLRFTPAEAAAFLNQVMGLNLSAENIAALETRTEGWIAGLQLAALSMRGHQDVTGFIGSFTGSHHFVLDYLVEEVLQQQPAGVQAFLLRTSILDRLCGPLCDAVLTAPAASGQETLKYLERANLFIVPLDNERRWYRYHHLFAELLRQRLNQSAASSTGDEVWSVPGLHLRTSQWFEDNGLELEAFRHAAAANDVERAERLIEGDGIPLHFRGVVSTILDWLESLPVSVLDAQPSLRVRAATLALTRGQPTGAEEKLQAAEAAMAAALPGAEPANKTRDLIGQIAAARATIASARYEAVTMIAQSRRALEYLHPDNLYSRFRANWTLARAYHYRGERAAAGQVYTEALSIAQASGDVHNISLATTCLGQIQELENQLYPAAETYRRALQMLGGDYLPPYASAAHLGLARICYEWDDLAAAQQHGKQSLQLARQYDPAMDRFVMSEVFLARLVLVQGDAAGAAAMLAETSRSAHQRNYVNRLPEVAAAQVLALLRLGAVPGRDPSLRQGPPPAQGHVAAAAHLAQLHDLPISQARVQLAQGDPAAALAALEPWRRQVEAKDWQDERLKVMVLQAVVLQAQGEQDQAAELLGDALALAEPGGFIRLFVDEGPPMAQLLAQAAALGTMPAYVARLLAAFDDAHEFEEPLRAAALPSPVPCPPSLVEPLSQRELEVLQLIALGLSNREIGERLFLALSTVKGHNRQIFDKLQVQSRTEALARARELGLLRP